MDGRCPYVGEKVARRDGYLTKNFFGCFKKKFLRGTLLFFASVAAFAFCLFDFYALSHIALSSIIRVPIFALLSFLLFCLLEILFYLAPLCAWSELRLAEGVRIAFVLAVKHLPRSLLILAIALVLVVFSAWAPLATPFAITLFVLLSSLLVRPVFLSELPEVFPSTI